MNAPGPLRAWYRRRLDRRIGLGAVLLTVAMLSVGVSASLLGASYTVHRYAARQAALRSTRTADATLAHLLEIEGAVRRLARSTLVTGALADSAGREDYLRPLLEDQAIRHAFDAELAVCDDRAMLLLQSRRADPEGRPAPPASPADGCLALAPYEAMLRSGRGIRAIERPLGGVRRMVWVEPVWIPASRSYEGAVVVRVPTSRLLPEITEYGAWLMANGDVIARAGDAARTAAPVPDAATTSPVLQASPRWPLTLTVRTWSDLKELEPVPVRALVAAYLAGLLVLGTLSVFAARWLARRLTRPLHALNEAADSPAALEPATWQAAANSEDEVGELARHLQDMARRIQAELQDLDAQRRQAEAANAAKTTFLATISHEMRTPLNAVIGLTELAMRESGAPRAEHLRLVKRSADQLLSLINNVLDLTKIDAGVMRIETGVCDVAQIVQAVRDLALPLVRSKPVRFDVRVAPDVPARFEGDELRVTQVLVNLLSNAVKFTPAGFVDLAVEVVGEGAESRLVFRVTDTGLGIDEAQQARIFEPFEQADTSTTRRFGGTGLGLAISARLARLMGGHIELRSAPGRGSEFSLFLPCRPVLAADGEPAPPTGAEAENAGVAPGLVALVVDDEPVNRMILRAQLRELGVASREAASGEEAIRACLDDPAISLVFMDLHMPGMGGREASRVLRDRLPPRRRITLVACTADVMTEDRESCRRAGMSEYLSKPVTLSSLAALVERARSGAGPGTGTGTGKGTATGTGAPRSRQAMRGGEATG